MRDRWLLWVAWAGLLAAVVLLLWPVRAHRALWAVTVGSEMTSSVPVFGGELVTPIQVLLEGTAPREMALTSTVNTRVLLALGASLLGALAGVMHGTGHRSREEP